MTAPAQLSNRPGAHDSQLGPAVSGPVGVKPPCEATPTRSLPAPPPPVLPLAPPARRPVVRRRLRVPLGCRTREARVPAPRVT